MIPETNYIVDMFTELDINFSFYLLFQRRALQI